MSRQLTSTEARIDNLTAYLTPILIVLSDLNDAFCPPFIQPIIKTTQALIAGVQNVKRNKDQCLQLVESIHPVLLAILRIHLESETVGSLPPAILDDVAEFTHTLHKTYTCIEMQQDGNRIKRFFRQGEAHGLLKECQNKLDQAFNVFTGLTTLTVLNNAIQVQNAADAMHQELIELISTLSDGTMSDRSSSVFYNGASGSQYR
ncbi:hypothetical protein B0H16DRAFT_1723187 [Mycena metata]|uniref:Mixed lineage kinase domain-containing protein n=1 Tax=Mycena metata TaxID=1033252 RepID=A0AAD7MGV1_9AGAR|nr:hypothetical protein B0H16DRAFT_1740917 [Mycena metata]KAJ7753569.1 hypothetical protein B0H16DRAFT_1723187 [Mycena metata]